MKTKYKAICTDIDGTLLNRERELSHRTISSIHRIKDNVPVILASSRMPSAMRHLQEQLNILHCPLICYNGGYVIQYSHEDKPQVFNSVTIDLNICKQIINLINSPEIHVSLYHEDKWYAPARDYWTEREERITKVKAEILANFEVLKRWQQNGNGAHKVMCMGPEDVIHQMEADLKKHVGDHIHIYRSRPTYLELAPRAINKGSALNLVLEKVYGLALHEAIAFGDNYNDIDMLQAAGLGIAVGNAKDEVRKAAVHITSNSIDDGVAEALEHFLIR